MIGHHLPSLLLSRAWLSSKRSILINNLGRLSHTGQSSDLHCCPGDGTRAGLEVVDYKREWKRRLLQTLKQPEVPDLAAMEGLGGNAKLVFQAAEVLGIRQGIIESAIRQFTVLQEHERGNQ